MFHNALFELRVVYKEAEREIMKISIAQEEEKLAEERSEQLCRMRRSKEQQQEGRRKRQ